MIFRRIISILVILIGVAMIFGTMYIREQIEEGKQKIAHAQEKVDQGNGLFGLTPFTRPIGKEATSSIQKKIEEGQGQIEKYEQIADNLQIGGIVLIVLGTFFLFTGRKKKK